ncbi:MAG TPA: hypothetical protein VFP14_05110 [Novosphingobium sp.]|nr:hypothetical protein [Novosphingobium sp.]
MNPSDSRADLLERARMHDRLASATDDADARRIHQALASELRRRAERGGPSNFLTAPAPGPMLELQP